VTQRYAYHSILETTQKQGFKAIEEFHLEDASIHLTLQRWTDLEK